MFMQVIRAKAPLTPFFMAQGQMKGYVHSCFKQAVNIMLLSNLGEERILTIVKQGMAQIPDSVEVEHEKMAMVAALQPNQIAVFSKGKLVIENMVLSWEDNAVELKPWEGADLTSQKAETFLTIYKELDLATGFDFLPEKARIKGDKGLEDFINTLITGLGNKEPWPIGLGKGTTPSGDDAMVGILATLGSKKNILTGEHLEKTTDISAKYLKTAQEGFFSQLIRDVWENLDSQSVKKLTMVGATSGMDMLYGMALACRWYLKKEEVKWI